MEPTAKPSPALFKTLLRGFRKRCPRCGQGRLFQNWYRLHEKCGSCGLSLLKDPIDILAFMYISTALISGFFIFGMFLVEPENKLLGRVLIGSIGLLAIVGSLPYRKGVALALEYWVSQTIDRSHE